MRAHPKPAASTPATTIVSRKGTYHATEGLRRGMPNILGRHAGPNTLDRGNRVTAHSPPHRHSGRGRWEPTLKQACSRINESATCVQRFDDSLNSAIRTTYRISLRSSSLWEPRHPLLKVVMVYFGWAAGCSTAAHSFSFSMFWGGYRGRRGAAARVGVYGSPGVGRSFDLSVMILPQVHLRKPCYDFYFL